jgi:hypothetical protein
MGKAFFLGRSQRVRVDGQIFEEIIVISGVPQGSYYVLYYCSLMLMIFGKTLSVIYGCSQMSV